jgi:lipoprotein LprG
MPSARALLTLLALPTLLTLDLAGCSKNGDTSTLPDGTTLVSESATAMKTVNSAHIVIDVDGSIGSLPIKKAEGDLKRSGDAKGSIQLLVFGQLSQLEFVLLGTDVYLKSVTGGWQKSSGGTAAFPYDPSAILNPDKGVAKLLATAKNAKTEGSDTIDGHDAWRVAVTFDSAAAAVLVPGVPEGLTGQVWLDKANKHLVKAIIKAPVSGSIAPATITVALTAIDVPVTINAP